MRRWILPAVAAMLCGTLVGIGAEERVHVLMIGNSYTRGISAAFSALAAATPGKIEVEYITPGGKTLLWHAASDKTLSRIKAKSWDVIVLQEQSQTPAYPGARSKFLKGARGLHEMIDTQGARTILFQTWGRRDGDKHNHQLASDYAAMQDLLSEGYAQASKDLGVDAAPAGEAWRRIHGTDKELFARLYRGDGSHPSAAGGYLAACVLYRTILGENPPKDAVPKGVSKADAATLWRLAVEPGGTTEKRSN
jgi:hypothetical protein